MGRITKYTNELRAKFLQEYESNGCKLYSACEKVGISEVTLNELLDKYPDFLATKKGIERKHAEGLEQNLDNLAQKNVIANIFRLKTHINQDVRDRFSDDPPVQILAPQNLWFNKNKDTKQIVEGESEKVA